MDPLDGYARAIASGEASDERPVSRLRVAGPSHP
jgi:hypothetical protein